MATGARSLMLGLPNEERLLGYGVSTCATCDGFFFRDHEIAVVGGGDSALEEALFLTRFADKVTVIHRRGELRASKVMQQRALANPKIEFRVEHPGDRRPWRHEGEGRPGARTSRPARSPSSGSPACSWPSATSPTPPSSRASSSMEDSGYLRTFGGTPTPASTGVFACGDVQDHRYRQAITAAGSGCMAAIDAERWLEDQAASGH